MSARREFHTKKRILIKAGTGVLTDEQGCVSLGRFGHLVEQVAELKRQGKEVILISSGAVAMGKQKLHESSATPSHNPRACAAAGQSGLMALYDSLFRQKDIWYPPHLATLASATACVGLDSRVVPDRCSQILLTDEDFLNENRRLFVFCSFLRRRASLLYSLSRPPLCFPLTREGTPTSPARTDVSRVNRRSNLRETVDELIRLGAVPILNENDVISSRKTPYTVSTNPNLLSVPPSRQP